MGVSEANQRPSRRPKDTPLKQQRMRAWQPVFSHKTSIKAFLGVGIVFLSIGAFWIARNKNISQVRFDYTRCHKIDLYDEPEVMPSENIITHLRASTSGHPLPQWKRTNHSITFDGVTKNYTLCTITFLLPDDLQPPVLFYYHLTNFHQNHRKYVTSLDEAQLKGKASRRARDPIRAMGETRSSIPAEPLPTLFNDTFANPRRFPAGLIPDATKLTTYSMSTNGIASEQEKPLFKPTTYPVPNEPGNGNDIVMVPPPNWAERFLNGYHSGNMFNPADDEAFMEVMTRGLYQLQAFSHFPAHVYDGKKSIIITTASSGVSRNEYLSIACIAPGAISLALTGIVALSVLHKQQALKGHDYLHRS
ncbi:ligand-effect modulator 3 family [Dactylonectria macrodidyma]|uniref:Ligand-effect modulator 3 family n=1 Tax=Dactylonectria macrodidyma TaxID=307937 RepID=A0A9P9EGC9_9HYPO|nr:ligand-effect modulator 3 family [Dactylonectria macrodidyma]